MDTKLEVKSPVKRTQFLELLEICNVIAIHVLVECDQ